MRRNGSEVTPGAIAGVGDGADGLTIGARYTLTLGWIGDIALFLVYVGALTTASIQRIEAAIRKRWPVY